MTKHLIAIGLLVAAAAAGAATPEGSDAATPTLSLTATATEEVPQDQMVVTIAVDREGPGIGTLNAAVLRELAWATGEAKKVEGVHVSTGNLVTHQAWGPNGKPTGWRVRGELLLKSKNMKDLGDLAGRLGERVQLGGVAFQLSREARDAVEAQLVESATAAFRQKASTASKALGYTAFTLKAVQLSSGWDEGGPTPLRMAAMSMASKAAEAVPVEAGKAAVTVSVTGTVFLTN